MGKIKFRHLFPEEVGVKLISAKSWGCVVALHKDARVDSNILDDAFPNNWESTYERKGNDLYCKLTLHTENGPRVFEDVGIPTSYESSKGEASDAFKRACTRAGIGRGLYTTERITIYSNKLGLGENCSDDDVKKAWTKADVIVSDIEFADGRAGEFVKSFELLSVKTGEIIYSYESRNREGVETITPEMKELRILMPKANMTEEKLCQVYGVHNLKEIAMSPNLFNNCKSRLEDKARKLEEKKNAQLDNIGEQTPVEAPQAIEDDPLNRKLAADNAAIEEERAPEPAPEPKAKEEKPEETAEESDSITLEITAEDCPPNLASYNGAMIDALPGKVVKELSRKNSKMRQYIAEESLKAVDARAEEIKKAKK